MTAVAITLVLLSAGLHACWNYLAKKSRNKVVFVWWFLLCSALLYLPMYLAFRPSAGLPAAGWGFVLLTGSLHFFYFFFLAGAYERGDLSLVYPLSRGSAPLFVPVLAILFIQERLSPLGMAGILAVVAGIYTIHLQAFHPKALIQPFTAMRNEASIWALATGGTIAGYSLVDKIGVGLVPPPVYIYLMNCVTLALLTPYILKRERRHIVPEWRANRFTIIQVSLLMTASYLLILFALQATRVSYVVAVREMSIVFSVLFGIVSLKERHGPQKLAGAAFISAGVIFIGLAR